MLGTRYSCQILVNCAFFRHIFEKYMNIKFHENPSNGRRVVLCGWIDGQTDKHDEANSKLD